MPKLKDQKEIDAYYLNVPAHPRAAGVMWPTLVERRIDQLFEIGFRPDKKVYNELFQPSGALGSYAVKVRLAYMLGWFQKDFYEDLILISKIRNRFAHEIEVKDFSENRIFAWLKQMKVYQLLPGMLESAKKRVADGRGSLNPRKEFDGTGKVTTDLNYQILKDTYDDPQMSFRFCIDLMLHQLDKYAENMNRNLTDLRENWMTADVDHRSNQ